MLTYKFNPQDASKEGHQDDQRDNKCYGHAGGIRSVVHDHHCCVDRLALRQITVKEWIILIIIDNSYIYKRIPCKDQSEPDQPPNGLNKQKRDILFYMRVNKAIPDWKL